jgi:predicted ATPase
MLLVLDNFEQLLVPATGQSGTEEQVAPPSAEATAESVTLVIDLLTIAPGLKLLVTSRAGLNIREEQRFPIGGIDFPPEQLPADRIAQPLDSRAAGRSPSGAVLLFRQAARRIQPHFELTATNWPDVAQICRFVAGMPLAIILAASWSELLSPAEIAAEIKQNFAFLATDLADVPARQRSMAAVFDHSWRLLSREEQPVLQQLSVFRGGFTRQALQAVTNATLPLLKSLGNKSFLQRTESGRYQVHELIRQFAAEKLAQAKPVEASARDRHSAYFCTFLQQREADLKGPRQQAALSEIEVESENVRLAWEWAVAQGQLERLEQAQESLGHFYQWRGRCSEGESVFQQAEQRLAKLLSGTQPRLLVRLLTWRSIFSYELGQVELANRLLQQSLAALNNPDLADQDTRRERALICQLMAAMTGGDVEKSRQLQKQSLSLFQAVGRDWEAAGQMIDLIFASYLAGDFAEARHFYQEANAILRRYSDLRGLANALMRMGNVAKHEEGQQEEAERLAREALALMKPSGDRFGLASAAYTLSVILVFCGNFAESQAVAQESLLLFNDLGHRRLQCFVNAWIGCAAMHLGDFAEGRVYCEPGPTISGARGSLGDPHW